MLHLCNLIQLRAGSKCPISFINAEAVIFHQYLSRQARNEASEGIQFGLGAFNQTISCCMIHKSNPCVAYSTFWQGLKYVIKRHLPLRSLSMLWLIYSPACAVWLQTNNIVLQVCVRQLYDACCGHGADTAVDSHKRRCPVAGGLEEPVFSHPLLFAIGYSVEHCGTVALMALEEKWTRSAALSHLRHFLMLTLLIQEYHIVHTLLPHSEHSHCCLKPKMKILSDMNTASSIQIYCVLM